MSSATPAISPAPAEGRVLGAIVVLLLVAVTFAVYHGAGTFEFVDFDDGEYVYENPHVASGVTLENVRWAFTTGHAANWHPLTWISHMVDVELFGLDAGRHHLVNVGIHAANGVLLFLLLYVMTGALWRSAAVAAIFAIHPLNVENVAWVSERKTLLSMLLALLAILAYVGWTRRRERWLYVLVCLLFALSLMSKPMAVTLPVLLVLLDVWPLNRTDLRPMAQLRPLIVEKLPLAAISTASAVITVVAQSASGAAGSVANFPFGERLLNAALSYGWYVLKAFFPSSLYVYYPHPSNVAQLVSRPGALAGFLFVVAASIVAWWMFRRTPVLAFGWCWYVVALLPMIGIIQVGAQARADRYAYLPLLGVFVAVIWTGFEACERAGAMRSVAAALLGVAILSLAFVAERQTMVWRSRFTLYSHALALNERNWMPWNNLGMTYFSAGQLDHALRCFSRAESLNPGVADIAYNIGTVYSHRQQYARALPWYRRALEIEERHADATVNLAIALLATGHVAEAERAYARALELRPDDPFALYGQSLIRLSTGRGDQVAADLSRLDAVAPEFSAELRARFPAIR